MSALNGHSESGVVDTDVVIAYLDESPEARAYLDALLARQEAGHLTLYYSALTILELWQSDEMDRFAELRILALLAHMTFVPMDKAIAATAGELLRSLSRTQRRRMYGDAIVAASAKVLGLPVHTRNVDDFRRLHSTVRSY